jgi:hypothetical protein
MGVHWCCVLQAVAPASVGSRPSVTFSEDVGELPEGSPGAASADSCATPGAGSRGAPGSVAAYTPLLPAIPTAGSAAKYPSANGLVPFDAQSWVRVGSNALQRFFVCCRI